MTGGDLAESLNEARRAKRDSVVDGGRQLGERGDARSHRQRISRQRPRLIHVARRCHLLHEVCPPAIRRDWQWSGLRIGPQQVQNFAIAIVAMGSVFVFLAFTRTGKSMRAVADNPVLAGLKGINADAVARLVNFVGMGLAGVGGMLIGLDTTIDPLTGFRVILSVFAAAVVGGLGSIPGAVVGALSIGVAEELSLLALSPAYRTAVGFVAILLVLTLRPRGILGERAY